jgi:hypothetical protein
MHPLTPDRRGEAVAYAERHSDPLVRDAIRALQEENAVLREVIAEDQPGAMTPASRRFVGRIVTTLLLVAGLVVAGAIVSKGRSNRAFQEGFREGMNAGAGAAVPAIPAIPVIPAVPAVPAVPAPPPQRP